METRPIKSEKSDKCEIVISLKMNQEKDALKKHVKAKIDKWKTFINPILWSFATPIISLNNSYTS